jgi:hypothetical protein
MKNLFHGHQNSFRYCEKFILHLVKIFPALIISFTGFKSFQGLMLEILNFNICGNSLSGIRAYAGSLPKTRHGQKITPAYFSSPVGEVCYVCGFKNRPNKSK